MLPVDRLSLFLSLPACAHTLTHTHTSSSPLADHEFHLLCFDYGIELDDVVSCFIFFVGERRELGKN